MSSTIFIKIGFRALSVLSGFVLLRIKGLLYIFLENITARISNIMNETTLIRNETRKSPSEKGV